MITGDAFETAVAIGNEIGILNPDDGNLANVAFTGSDF
jgi:magnesium-transporting ATPase (P-type)